MINTRNAQRYLNRSGEKLKKKFTNEMLKRLKKLSVDVQEELNESVEKGAVAFTKRAVLFTYKKRNEGFSAAILIKKQQAKYLRDVIVTEKNIEKIVPTSAARLNKYGNISQLKSNLNSKKFIIVKGKNGKERLIDTSKKDTKRKTKRVIGLRENKKRKLIYDFYGKVNAGVQLTIQDVRGYFIISRGR